jgi:hypothetical protein
VSSSRRCQLLYLNGSLGRGAMSRILTPPRALNGQPYAAVRPVRPSPIPAAFDLERCSLENLRTKRLVAPSRRWRTTGRLEMNQDTSEPARPFSSNLPLLPRS